MPCHEPGIDGGAILSITLADIEAARRAIAGHVLSTPMLPAPRKLPRHRTVGKLIVEPDVRDDERSQVIEMLQVRSIQLLQDDQLFRRKAATHVHAARTARFRVIRDGGERQRQNQQQQ